MLGSFSVPVSPLWQAVPTLLFYCTHRHQERTVMTPSLSNPCEHTNTCAGEYVALEAVETCLLGGAGDIIANGCCWCYADATQRRLVAFVVPDHDA